MRRREGALRPPHPSLISPWYVHGIGSLEVDKFDEVRVVLELLEETVALFLRVQDEDDIGWLRLWLLLRLRRGGGRRGRRRRRRIGAGPGGGGGGRRKGGEHGAYVR